MDWNIDKNEKRPALGLAAVVRINRKLIIREISNVINVYEHILRTEQLWNKKSANLR